MADVNVFFVAELTNEYFPDKYFKKSFLSG